MADVLPPPCLQHYCMLVKAVHVLHTCSNIITEADLDFAKELLKQFYCCILISMVSHTCACKMCMLKFFYKHSKLPIKVNQLLHLGEHAKVLLQALFVGYATSY